MVKYQTEPILTTNIDWIAQKKTYSTISDKVKPPKEQKLRWNYNVG